MEQIGHGKAEQDLHLEGQKLLSGVEKSSVISPIPLQTSFASLTPAKTVESSQIKRTQDPVDLPEKYKILSEFFDRLICSIRLLTLRKKLTIFRNISVQVERLTGRAFQYKHLAQIKHILPEAMKIEKILIHDKETLCMKPDLNITLISNFIEDDSEPSIFVAMSNLFASRLKRFFSSHPEVSDVPEAELPDPFNQSGTTITDTDSSCKELLMPIETDLSNPSHLGASFNRRFSRDNEEIKKTQLFISPSPDSLTNVDHKFDHDEEMETNQESLDVCESTPLKLPLQSDEKTLETPAQITPKRSDSTCENKQKSVMNENNIASSLSAKRSLYFTHSEDDILKVKENDITSTCLSNLVPVIHGIFESAKCNLITKEELVHKILMNSLDIDENCDVEEQIELLEKLVPDWICKKCTSSGELYSVKKVSDLSTVRERLISI